MRIFVYEYTCALGTPGLPPSLCAEGRAMLSAVVHDFENVPGVRTDTLRLHSQEDAEEPAFRRLAAAADWTLVLAPETDDLLCTRCRWVLEAGGRLLGPSPEAVALTGDKLALARHLHQHGIPTPPTVALTGPVSFPAVCKPRYGAGSQATVYVPCAETLAAAVGQARQEAGPIELLLQPFVSGQPVSVALLVGTAGTEALVPAAQHLSPDGRFRYLGGRIPLAPALGRRARQLGARAVAAVAGLKGYVGVDLVLGTADDGSADQIIEINPRLTTSYVGLRRLAGVNLAAAMLRAAAGLPVGELAWEDGAVCFRADGTVEQERPSGARAIPLANRRHGAAL